MRGISFWVALVLVASFLGLGVAVRRYNLANDFAVGNVAFIICAFFAGVTIVVWLSAFAFWGWRRLIPPLCLIALVALPIPFIKEVDGEMMPVFGWPFWSPDERLEVPPPVVENNEEEIPTIDLATATEDDFPNFLGPDMAQHVQGVELERDWQKHPPRLVWQQEIGAGWSAFATRNGYAVTMEQRGEHELVTCYEIATGELQWSHGVETRYETVLGGVGPRATPTIDEQGRVFANGATGVLRCIDGNTGMLLWQVNLLKELGISPERDASAIVYGRSNSPLVVDNYVVVPGGESASLVAFDANTGELAWRGGKDQIAYASPIVGELDGVRQIVSVNEASVTGHATDTGAVLWSFPWGHKGSSAGESNNSQPIVVGDNRLFVSKSYFIGATLKEIKQSPSGSWVVDKKWSKASTLRTKFTNVIIHDGYVYGLSDGILECVDVATGDRRWKKGRFHQGQILGVGSVILVINEKSGEVSMIEMSPDGYNKLGEFEALDTDKVWNHLALHGNYLLVRDSLTAACWELPLAD